MLTSEDVRDLVFQSIELIAEAQEELDLPICPSILETRERLRSGVFTASLSPKNEDGDFNMTYGSFDPPTTIILDGYLPFCDWPMDIPKVADSMTHFTATHEVIHADDHTGGDHILLATKEHIFEDHRDKLEKGMQVIEARQETDCICSYEDLASLWAMNYVDILTHYRTYVVLRHHDLPRLDMIWDFMQGDFFPPGLLTRIEAERDTRYIFDSIICRPGSYCLIDALMESNSISAKNATTYTV